MINRILSKLSKTQIMMSISISIALIIDSLVISRYLGTSAIAGYGAASPIIWIIMALAGVISTGSQIVCADHIGKADTEGANRIVGLSVVITLIYAAVFVLLIFGCTDQVIWLIGIDPGTELSLSASSYLKGFMLGAPVFIGTLTLMPFVQLDGNRKLALLSMTSITVSDIIGDIMAAFVFKTGIFGIGVASAVSYYIGASILLSHFILKKGTLRIHFDHLPWKETKKFFSLGSTSAIQKILKTMFGLTANRILLINGGASALAAYTVIMNISNLANCCGQGISGAVMLMSGVIASDSDKTSLIELCKSFIKKSALYNFILTTIIIVAARPIVYIFWTDGADISTVVTGVRIISLSFFFYTLCMCFRNYYQGIKKTRIAMFITFLLGYGLSGTFAITLGLRFGLYGVCASYPLAEITTLIFIVILVWIINKRIPSRIEDFLLLPPDFDIPEENIYEITITDLDEVMDASKKVFEFAKQHGIQEENDRRAVVLSLAVEELAKNVITYGFKDDSSNHLDIRLCVKEDKMILRIRDDCDKFSPIDYMNQFAGHRPDKGFGITMISNLASDIKYLNTFGLNIVNITA